MKTKNGITLIALIITIIVLLILAGISISMIVGENGILNQAQKSVVATTRQGERESIQRAVQEIVTNKIIEKEPIEIEPEELKEIVKKENVNKNINVSEKRVDEEYIYIVDIDDSKYGIDKDNQVFILENGIYDQYININEVKEVSPIYNFTNTITQSDVDNQLGMTDVEYVIDGISASEDGEYVRTSVEGKSGTLSVVGDIQNANFQYQLTNFFQGDDIFYVKIKTDELEIIQKLIIVQGDVVTYEENFMGITYTGNWSDMESEELSNGKAKITEERGASLEFSCYTSGYDYVTYCDSNCGLIVSAVKRNGISLKGFLIDFYTDKIEEQKYVKASGAFEGYSKLILQEGKDESLDNVNIKIISTSRAGGTSTSIIDSIIIHK